MTRRFALGVIVGIALGAGVLAITLGAGGGHTAAGRLDPGFGRGGTVQTRFWPAATLTMATAAVAIGPDGNIVAAGGIGPTGGSGVTFGRYSTNGHLESRENSRNTGTDAIAIQPDGKVVVALFDPGSGFGLARYTTSGSLDPSFGTGGKVRTDFGSVFAVAIKQDGKILVEVSLNSRGRVALARYTATGALDMSFGTGGTVKTNLTQVATPSTLAIQPDGKVVVAGWASLSLHPEEVELARYTASGTLDTSFGAGGEAPMHFAKGIGVTAVAIGSDGKIVVAGDDGDKNFLLARFTANGERDTRFGTDGQISSPIGGGGAVAIEPDEKVVVAGILPGDLKHFAGLVLGRYTRDGTLDARFGTRGKAVTRFPGSVISALSVAIPPDGKIVVGGYADTGFALARYLP